MHISRLLHQLQEPPEQTNPDDIPDDVAAKLLAFPWRFKVYHPELQAVKVEALKFAAAVLAKRKPRWLSLLGPSGIGKTLTSQDIMRFLRKHWPRIQTQTGFRPPQIAHIVPAEDLGDYKAARAYAGYDLVYIEDIGAGQFGDKGAGAVTKGRVIELLQLRTGKWTLLDANLYRGDIASQLDSRIASRLRRDGSVCIEVSDAVPDFNG